MIEVDDLKVYPIGETEKDFAFEMDKRIYTIHKKGGWGIGDTRFLINDSYLYDDIGFDVEDGVAVSNGIGSVNKCGKENPIFGSDFDISCEERIHDIVKASFPSIISIFSNQNLFDIAWSYMHELGISFTEWLENGGNDLTPFFEGFFFNGGYFITYDIKHE